jgi:hypothetical protein
MPSHICFWRSASCDQLLPCGTAVSFLPQKEEHLLMYCPGSFADVLKTLAFSIVLGLLRFHAVLIIPNAPC